MADDRYIQRLPALELTIERATERTPDASRYHLFRGDELLQSFRRLPEAQQRFRELRDESDWQPQGPDTDDPDEPRRWSSIW